MNKVLDRKEGLSPVEEPLAEVNHIEPQKRVFIGLLAVTCLLLGGLA